MGRPDGYLLGTGVAWQVDSHRHHASEDGLEQTLVVHDAFAAARGLPVIHSADEVLSGRRPG